MGNVFSKNNLNIGYLHRPFQSRVFLAKMAKSLVFTVTTDLTHDQRMLRIASTLAQAGYEVTLVGRLLPQSLEMPATLFKTHRIRCHFLKGPFFYLEYNLRLLGWFLTHSYDLYGAIDTDTALAALTASAFRRKPLIYDAHELFPELPEVVHRPLVRKVWSVVERLAFTRASLAYTVSGSLVAYFEAKYCRPVHLVQNMPLRQLGPLVRQQEPPYFIYQGALNEGRGLETLLLALQHVPARLVVCGEGPLRGRLQQMTHQLGLQDQVEFKGNVLPTDLIWLTAGAWAGIMLLEENRGLSYFYSLANKFFDYVQAGIPQVCVPFPEYQRLNAQHEVALLARLGVEEVKTALLTLLHNQETYLRLRQNCLMARTEWCWEMESQKLTALYNEIK